MTSTTLAPEIVTAPARTVVGTAKDYTMETRGGIPAQWQSYFDAGLEVANMLPGAMFGVSFDMDGDGGFRYAVAIEVASEPAELPEGTCVMTLSAGDHAVLRRFGPVSKLPEDFERMFRDWLPGSDFVQREGAVFEVYPHDPRNGPDGMAYEIWVPVTAMPMR
jgi:AraC family transcriptional regulator